MKRTPLSKKLDRQLLHTTDERIDLLAEIGIHTVYDLLEFYPRHTKILPYPPIWQNCGQMKKTCSREHSPKYGKKP
jgi:hypothetical protein